MSLGDANCDKCKVKLHHDTFKQRVLNMHNPDKPVKVELYCPKCFNDTAWTKKEQGKKRWAKRWMKI